MRVDPSTNLGLALDSIDSYRIGDQVRSCRGSNSQAVKPELLPYGYLVGEAVDIHVNLSASDASVDSLAFEAAIPKPVLQR